MATKIYKRPGLGTETVKIVLNNETSDAVAIPPGYVGIEAIVTTGTARVEQTAAPESDIADGSCYWFPWASGTVSAPTSSIVVGASAVRCVATGQTVFYVRF